METWNLRLATLDDSDALRALISLSARGLNSEHYTPEQVESILTYVYGVDTQLILDQTYFVVQDRDAFVGCGGWSRRKTLYGGDQHKADSPDNLLDPATEAARIRAFFVHPASARKGIGSALMQACEDAAKAAGFHKLELMATLTGEYLYARFGFTPVEETDVVLPDGNVMKVRRMIKDIALSE
ncbi:MAG: GNAT family N-acetyltransferase [Anaerolineae bacterium]|nr:GNAT family N-acetyltransferase [Anaerolineae bacterium]MCA9911583.1 GNAT family N-acetyltransferase [Anaerolineae bacterium]